MHGASASMLFAGRHDRHVAYNEVTATLCVWNLAAIMLISYCKPSNTSWVSQRSHVSDTSPPNINWPGMMLLVTLSSTSKLVV